MQEFLKINSTLARGYTSTRGDTIQTLVNSFPVVESNFINDLLSLDHRLAAQPHRQA